MEQEQIRQKEIEKLKQEMEDMRRAKDAVIAKMIQGVETQRKKYEATINDMLDASQAPK
jgi:flagellar biosynthesis chaperone FliJ